MKMMIAVALVIMGAALSASMSAWLSRGATTARADGPDRVSQLEARIHDIEKFDAAIRLDLFTNDMSPDAIKPVGSNGVVGIPGGWMCGPIFCLRSDRECAAIQAALAKKYPNDTDFRDACAQRGFAFCIEGEASNAHCFVDLGTCEKNAGGSNATKACIGVR